MPNSQNVPSAQFGVCGGSGSLSFDFPAALDDERVTVLAEDLVFDTPFGTLPGVHPLPRRRARTVRARRSRSRCTAGGAA